MSKKLIAVASAAALALSVLVGVAPASATPTVTHAGFVTGSAGTSISPYVVNVVADSNTISAGASNAAAAITSTAIRVKVTAIAAGDTVKVTTTGSVKVIDTEVAAANALIDTRKLGSSSYSKTLTSGVSWTGFIFATDTTAGTYVVEVTKTDSGTTSTTTVTSHVKAQAGQAYKVANVTAPATLATGASADVTFNVTDASGNVIEVNAGVEALEIGSTTFAATWDSVRKLNVARITSATNNPFIITIKNPGATDLDGFEDHDSDPILVVNNAGVSAQIATLTTQLAEANAKLAKRVTKKRFNTLARKWNAAFPSQKVALKK
jgi:hypothetical protein